MLSIATVQSAAGAATYYSADNYYTQGQLLEESAWHGRGAAALGLEGKVAHAQFEAVLAGRLPNGEVIADGKRGPHRPGFDLTFSAPKSVSLLTYIGGDDRLKDAHMAAVKAALDWAEARFAEARVTKAGGGQEAVQTGKLVVALFAHDTSRLMDPQMHVHAVIANATEGPDGRSRALAERPVWESKAIIASVYNAFLRIEVERLGYDIALSGKHGQFEIAGIPRQVIEAFSQRRLEIQEQAAKLQHQTPMAMAAVALRSRGDKPRDVDRAELHAEWRARAKALGFETARLVEAAKARAALQGQSCQRLVQGVRGIGAQTVALAERLGLIDPAHPRDPLVPERPERMAPDAWAAAQAVASAVRQLSEREAGFRAVDIVKLALDKGAPVTVEHIEARVGHLVSKGLLIAGADGRMMTTAQALAAEQEYLAQVAEGQGRAGPLLPRDEQGRDGGAQARDRAQELGLRLNKGQRGAAQTILESRDRTVHVQGVAGAGKSVMLKPVAELAQAHGCKVIGLAVSHAIANRLNADVGIETVTVAKFLATHKAAIDPRADPDQRKAAQTSLKGALLVVDEASMLSTRDATRLVAIANAAEVGRLALVGDSRQLGAVEAGKPFALGQRVGTALLDQNLRARTPEMQAIHAAAQAHDAGALGRLIRPHTTEAPGLEALTAANQWMALPAGDRERTALFVSGRALRAEVNAEVQRLRRDAGEVGPAVMVKDTLVPVHITREEQKLASSYAPGQVIELARPLTSQGLPVGLMEVVGVRKGGVIEVQLADGRTALFRPGKLANNRVEDAVRLYARQDIRLHAGDPIRWTGSDPKRGLFNGEAATYVGRDGDALLFRDAGDREFRLEREDPMLKRLDLAYALNAHQAQGATADRAILVARASEGKLITATNLAVLFTRAREEVHLVTDDLDLLTGRTARQSGEKTSAIEVALNVAPAVKVEVRRPEQPKPVQQLKLEAKEPDKAAVRQPPVKQRDLGISP
ncbi:MAG: MobF family relaxase [Sphingomonadaceae bacterium]